MDFKKLLDDYMKQLDCTAKDLAENSGLSAATISRYRSGERIPEDGSENFDRLINGIVSIAENKKIPNITVQSVSEAFSPYVRNNVDIAHLQKNFHTLLTVVPINISDLARFLILYFPYPEWAKTACQPYGVCQKDFNFCYQTFPDSGTKSCHIQLNQLSHGRIV